MPCLTDLWGRSPACLVVALSLSKGRRWELDHIPACHGVAPAKSGAASKGRMGEDPRAIRQLTESGSRMRAHLCIRVLRAYP
jgi:hypothetical protein